MSYRQYHERLRNVLIVTLLAAAPTVAAQSLNRGESRHQPRKVVVPRSVNVPGYGEVYVVPLQAKDTRTAKQRCVDDEAKRVVGTLSDLDKASIGLKCSQR